MLWFPPPCTQVAHLVSADTHEGGLLFTAGQGWEFRLLAEPLLIALSLGVPAGLPGGRPLRGDHGTSSGAPSALLQPRRRVTLTIAGWRLKSRLLLWCPWTLPGEGTCYCLAWRTAPGPYLVFSDTACWGFEMPHFTLTRVEVQVPSWPLLRGYWWVTFLSEMFGWNRAMILSKFLSC